MTGLNYNQVTRSGIFKALNISHSAAPQAMLILWGNNKARHAPEIQGARKGVSSSSDVERLRNISCSH